MWSLLESKSKANMFRELVKIPKLVLLKTWKSIIWLRVSLQAGLSMRLSKGRVNKHDHEAPQLHSKDNFLQHRKVLVLWKLPINMKIWSGFGEAHPASHTGNLWISLLSSCFFFFLIVALTTCHVHGKKEVLKISNLIFMLNRSVFIDPRSFSCPGRPCRWAPNKENAGCIICWIAWYPQALYVHSMLYLEN